MHFVFFGCVKNTFGIGTETDRPADYGVLAMFWIYVSMARIEMCGLFMRTQVTLLFDAQLPAHK